MAFPKWITPAGDLGTVPETEYYQYDLDAVDSSGGTLVFTLVSGTLPKGIQVVETGRLQGIPVSELGGDLNVNYKFTIRVTNSTTKNIVDRTFNLTITNVYPPIISTPPRNSSLGVFIDGSEYSQQFAATESTPGATLYWDIQSGTIPPGTKFTSTGLLSGYFEPIPAPGAGNDPDWDSSAWSFLDWDASTLTVSKTFTFTVRVTDGTLSDLSTYTLTVQPSGSITADSTNVTVDSTAITVDASGSGQHNPIILTTQSELGNVREGSYFDFQFRAIDLDGDTVYWEIPALATGSFDEQTSPLYDYFDATISSGMLTVGIFPDVSTVVDSANDTSVSTLNYNQYNVDPGTVIKVRVSNGLPEFSGRTDIWTEATIASNVTVRITGNTFLEAQTGRYLTQASSGSNATITSQSAVTGNLTFRGEDHTGFIDILRPTYQITFAQNILANVGDYITQSSTSGNARVTAAVGTAGGAGGNVANVIFISNSFENGNAISSSNIAIRGLAVAAYPSANVKDIYNTTINANIGDIITQTGSSGNATVTANIVDFAKNIPVRYTNSTFNKLGGNIILRGSDAGVWITSVNVATSTKGVTFNEGDHIYQYSTTANAKVTANVINASEVSVIYNSGTFSANGVVLLGGESNIEVNGSNVSVYPTRSNTGISVTATYFDTAKLFDINSNLATAIPKINTVSMAYAKITSVEAVGVSLGSASTEGTVGFDAANFDQGVLNLPTGISLTEDSGWLTGFLPDQTISSITYEFQISAYKLIDPSYRDTGIFYLTVLGDLNNTISWDTDSNLGDIRTGSVSDLSVSATSAVGKSLYYELTANSAQRLPQGLQLGLDGLIYGRVSFSVYMLDQGATTMDGSASPLTPETTFDLKYTFNVTARDASSTITSNRTFNINVVAYDKIPYENLYLKALPSSEQRDSFQTLMGNTTIFPQDKIYRSTDPWFGKVNEISTLFLAGLSPSTLQEYVNAASTNHFTKRFLFGNVQHAQALDDDFNVKYEVVYIDIEDQNSNIAGYGPPNSINLEGTITNPYYDSANVAYYTAFPNSKENMSNVMISSIGYQNKGILPDWMTSRQPNGAQLGFKNAVVLAYTHPGCANLIAYRLNQREFEFNTIDFSVDRYQLDNVYSENYDITSNTFLTSSETTFDRYPALSSTFTYATTVDYAVSTAFDEINQKYLPDLVATGALDGIKSNIIVDGQTIVFAQQEYTVPGSTAISYTEGWNNVVVTWDTIGFDDAANNDWDPSTTISGYNEYIIGPDVAPTNPLVPTDPQDGNLAVVSGIVYAYDADETIWHVANQRAGVWKLNIDANAIVTLTLVRGIDYYDTLWVREGDTYRDSHIYFDPIVKTGSTVPNFSLIPQTINSTYTTWDGNGTRFYNYRDKPVVPEQGDKYIKYTKTGVFT